VKAERLQQVSPIFHQVVELPPEERAAFLASACKGDATLREDVESMGRLIKQYNLKPE